MMANLIERELQRRRRRRKQQEPDQCHQEQDFRPTKRTRFSQHHHHQINNNYNAASTMIPLQYTTATPLFSQEMVDRSCSDEPRDRTAPGQHQLELRLGATTGSLKPAYNNCNHDQSNQVRSPSKQHVCSHQLYSCTRHHPASNATINYNTTTTCAIKLIMARPRKSSHKQQQQQHQTTAFNLCGGKKSSSSSFLLTLVSLVLAAFLMNLIAPLSQTIHFAAASNIIGQQLSLSQSQQQQQQQQQVNPVIQMPSSASTTTTTTTTTATNPVVSGKARYKTMYACEDRQLTMDCDYGSMINLIRANFGRFSITQCNEQGQLDLSTDCMSPITFRIMQERCQDKQKCSVNATSLIFGDRCPKTRKYLEVHFQCQLDPRASQHSPSSSMVDTPERVDLRSPSNQFVIAAQPPAAQPANVPNVISSSGGSSPILPPNNPTHLHPAARPQPPPSIWSTGNPYTEDRQPSTFLANNNNHHQNDATQQQPKTVINSEIMTYSLADNYNDNNNYKDPATINHESIIVTMRHTHVDNMSNPRCFLWDQTAKQWSQQGSRILASNQTHTTCTFDQATSYLLVMDYLGPLSMINTQPNAQNSPSQEQILITTPTQQNQVPPFDSPIPGMLDNQPVILDHHPQQQQPPVSPFDTVNSRQQQQQQSPGAVARFLSMFSYLVAIVFVAIALLALALVATTMRSSAGAALKSLGNFAPFNGGSGSGSVGGGYKSSHHHHRRQDGVVSSTLHSNKDLLVINNQNGHQFLYAPASTTKISSSSSTHILSGQPSAVGQHHQGTLHQIQQQRSMYSDNGGTLSQLSAAGAHSNNYYYGLMGSIFQQQQQQLNNNQQMQQQQQQQQQQQHVQQAASYNHQANKSTLSQESANSSSNSSSGIESGSTSMHHQQAASMQQPPACLVPMNNGNNDYNLMGHHLTNYGQQQQHNVFNGGAFAQHQQQQQPALTLNAHYSASGAGLQPPLGGTQSSGQQQQQHHVRQSSNALREHIYECVDDDKPYTARLLMPMNNEQQFGTLGHHQHHNQAALDVNQQQWVNSRAMTLSTRLLQDALQQQQHHNLQHHQASGNQQQFVVTNSSTNKRLFHHQPAIVRDQQAAKTNIICSKLAQVTPQRATEISSSNGQKTPFQAQHDIMAIYNGQSESTTTTTSISGLNTNNSCYGRLDLTAGSTATLGATATTITTTNNNNNGGKLSTDC